MDKADVIVVGAGVVGLAVSARLAEKGKDVITIEKHPTFGQETSSRNSEVIHSGIYYQKNSLKAKLCVEGKALLYEFCDKYGVPYVRLGKLIVAQNTEEEKELEKLFQQGHINGVTDLIFHNKDDVRIIQPNIRATAAIESPSTGIIDTHRFMKTLELQAGLLDAHIVLGQSYREQKRFDAAIEELEQARELSHRNPLILGVLGSALAVAGRQAEAREILGELIAISEGADAYVAPLGLAALSCGLGERDEVFCWLDLALDAHDGLVRYLKVYPVFDALRDDPRFAVLLRRVGLGE